MHRRWVRTYLHGRGSTQASSLTQEMPRCTHPRGTCMCSSAPGTAGTFLMSVIPEILLSLKNHNILSPVCATLTPWISNGGKGFISLKTSHDYYTSLTPGKQVQMEICWYYNSLVIIKFTECLIIDVSSHVMMSYRVQIPKFILLWAPKDASSKVHLQNLSVCKPSVRCKVSLALS